MALWVRRSCKISYSPEMCTELRLIVASFFFSRASQSRNKEKRLVSSFAYQLAIFIPATQSHIESAVQIDPRNIPIGLWKLK